MTAKRPARRYLQICLPMLLVFASLPALAQQAQRDRHAPLQERMSYAEFKRLGLDKLSARQLKELNAWLETHGDSGPSMDSMVPATSRTVSKAKADKVIHTHIVGTFRGWGSDTTFTLANGQRWQVADDSSLMIRSMHDPKVTLHKGFFGTWLLNVDGVDQSVHVTRLH